MSLYLIKVIISVVVIVGVTELSKRGGTFWGGVLASLPLTSLLAFIWLYSETGDTARIASLSRSIFFTPCFLWVFLGGPHIEQLRGNKNLTDALSTITAAIVGVILNLAVWFALHVFFPKAGAVDWFTLGISAVAFLGMLRWKWSVIAVVCGSGLLRLVYQIVVIHSTV